MSENAGRHDTLVALNVVDDDLYDRYRAGMTPLLEARGGFFGHDFRVGEVLRSAVDHPVNRVFVISFPDEATRESYFASEDYLAVRREFFDPAVEGATVLAQWVVGE
ncbi:MAG: DUF1330 domain-containing protein [Gemmatimonadota bacterium]